MAGDLATALDTLTSTLDAAVGVTAYWVSDLSPNALPTTAYVALQQIPQGALSGFDGLSFGDFVVQVTSYSPTSFRDALTKAQAAFAALGTEWALDSGPALHMEEDGWRACRFDIRSVAALDSFTT